MTRNEIEVAFEALFTPLVKTGKLKSVSRRFKLWDQVMGTDKPCMFITKYKESNPPGDISTPNIQSFNMALWIYTDVGQDQKIIPISKLNDILDDVTDMFRGSPIFGNVTLGTRVVDARISGDIDIVDGALDGNGVAFVPVRILIPSL